MQRIIRLALLWRGLLGAERMRQCKECGQKVLGYRRVDCPKCGGELLGFTPEKQKPGIGDSLHMIIKRRCTRLGIRLPTSCKCRMWARKMNRWGPEGCRKHRAVIVEHLVKEMRRVARVRLLPSPIKRRIAGRLVDAVIKRFQG